MNCWEVLGISPTEDQHQIKKAYAHAATLHHPEDDPDGFQIVYRAFKQAMAFAKQRAEMAERLSINREAVIPSADERVNPQIQEENSPRQPDFDTSLLQGAAGKSDEKEEPEPQQSDFDTTLLQGAARKSGEKKEESKSEQPEFDTSLLQGAVGKSGEKEESKSEQPDFDTSLLQGAAGKSDEKEKSEPQQSDFDTTLLQGAAGAEENQTPWQSTAGAETDSQGEEYDYEGVIYRGEAAEKKKIKTILETLDLNYQERKTLHSTKMWKQCFSSAEFLALRSNEEFTRQFLTYQMDHIDIKPYDWVRVFAPMLREWLYYWPVGELSEKFHFLLRQRNKYGFIKKPTTRRRAKIRFLYIFLCILLIDGAIGAIMSHNNANSKNSSSMPSISVPIYQLSPDTELGSLLKIEDVLIGAENHTDYSKLQKKCEDLGVSREKYEQMQAEYAAGDKKSFDRDRDEIMDRNSKSRSSSSGETSAVSEPAAEKQGSD